MKLLKFTPSQFLPVLLIEERSGVAYAFQIGGTACWERIVEGVIYPVAVFPGSENVGKSLHEITHELAALESKVADQVDECLSKDVRLLEIKVDRERLHESLDQWVHVIVSRADPTLLSGFSFPLRCVLTW